MRENEEHRKSWAIFPEKCIKIPHCRESDGVRFFCESCDNGFELNNEICVRNKVLSIEDCEEYDDKN